jgi:hypothetical protein
MWCVFLEVGPKLVDSVYMMLEIYGVNEVYFLNFSKPEFLVNV